MQKYRLKLRPQKDQRFLSNRQELLDSLEIAEDYKQNCFNKIKLSNSNTESIEEILDDMSSIDYRVITKEHINQWVNKLLDSTVFEECVEWSNDAHPF